MHIGLMSLSLRKDSFNTKLLHLAEAVVKDAKIDYHLIDLNQFPLPAFSQDIEAKGMPDVADKLKAEMERCTDLIICSPEYNFSYPGHFKNTFDWLSRYTPMPWRGRNLLLMSASMSLVGGNRGLWHLRVPFEATGTIVYPDMFSLAAAHTAFEDNGQLKDKVMGERFNGTVRQFLSFIKKLSA